mmetsp:Transcript_30269/g.69628  ORF Transcript_30269/g.69628 Transcript_30269/m.69628 type:complete len:222 (-) Transcript_30269:722-1387(-)
MDVPGLLLPTAHAAVVAGRAASFCCKGCFCGARRELHTPEVAGRTASPMILGTDLSTLVPADLPREPGLLVGLRGALPHVSCNAKAGPAEGAGSSMLPTGKTSCTGPSCADAGGSAALATAPGGTWSLEPLRARDSVSESQLALASIAWTAGDSAGLASPRTADDTSLEADGGRLLAPGLSRLGSASSPLLIRPDTTEAGRLAPRGSGKPSPKLPRLAACA